MPARGGGVIVGGPAFKVSAIHLEDKGYAPFPLEVRDPLIGKTRTVTVIGVRQMLDSQAIGLHISARGAQQVVSFPVRPSRYYFVLGRGVDAAQTARDLNSAFLTTLLPARQASRIYPAEALRYE